MSGSSTLQQLQRQWRFQLSKHHAWPFNLQESSLSTAGQRQQPQAEAHGPNSIPESVWQLCGVSEALQFANLAPAAEALAQLDSIQCPLEVVTCLQRADQAITQAVGQVR